MQQHLTESYKLALAAISFTVISLFLITPLSYAATITVNSAADNSVGCTLREAIASIQTNNVSDTGCTNSASPFGFDDKVRFDTNIDTVNITNTLIIDAPLTIEGNTSKTTIQGNGTHHVFYIDTRRSKIIFKDLTISDGNATLPTTGSTLPDSGRGGGIYVKDTILELYNVTISNNTAKMNGGGVYSVDSSIVLNDSLIINNNSDEYGGGLFMLHSPDSTSADTLTINNTTVADNHAGEEGGGLDLMGVDVTISNSTISGNTSNSDGGGVYANFCGMKLYNSTVSGNYSLDSYSGGGGLFIENSSELELINTTIAKNTAPYGGGLYARSSIATLKNTIIADSTGDDCLSSSSTITADSYNIIEDNTCFTSARSGDPKLEGLAINHGITKSHNPRNKSIAVDSGNNSICSSYPINNKDQRGKPRPVGERCDIGSVEYFDDGGFYIIKTKNGKTAVIYL